MAEAWSSGTRSIIFPKTASTQSPLPLRFHHCRTRVGCIESQSISSGLILLLIISASQAARAPIHLHLAVAAVHAAAGLAALRGIHGGSGRACLLPTRRQAPLHDGQGSAPSLGRFRSDRNRKPARTMPLQSCYSRSSQSSLRAARSPNDALLRDRYRLGQPRAD